MSASNVQSKHVHLHSGDNLTGLKLLLIEPIDEMQKENVSQNDIIGEEANKFDLRNIHVCQYLHQLFTVRTPTVSPIRQCQPRNLWIFPKFELLLTGLLKLQLSLSAVDDGTAGRPEATVGQENGAVVEASPVAILAG